MAVIRDDSQQTTANVSVVGEGGERKQVVSASCHIRPNRGASINVDVLDAAAITDANRAEVCSAVAEYISEELAKAAALGVPVGVPASE